LLPSALCRLSVSVEAERIVPRYLGARDLPWLEALFEVYAAFIGQKRSALRERLREPLAQRAPLAKLRVGSHVLDAIGRDRVSACVPPREARWALFRAAATSTSSRERTLSEVAATLGVSADALEAALFADLDGEKRVAALPGELTPEGFLPIANQAIVRSLLRRALGVRVRAFTDAGSLIQRARELGLICSVESMAPELFEDDADAAILRISGPFTLFRRTEVYARALAALLPALTRCQRFELEASCVMGPRQRALRLSVSSSDPIRTPEVQVTSASRVRERFVRDFRKAAPHWELNVVSPCTRANGTITFADFELVHRSDPGRRWQLEVLGFWTQEHLRQRLSRAAASGARTLLCIDETRACDADDLRPSAHCVLYKTRIDPALVLAVIESEPDQPSVGDQKVQIL